MPGVWMCDSCADPAVVKERIAREILENRRVQRALSEGRCPFSGLPLTDHGDGLPGTLSCGVCDCFGFERCGGCGNPREYGAHGPSQGFGGCV